MVLNIGWLLAKCFSSEVTERRPPVVYTGQGTFLDDITLPDILHAAVLRKSSPQKTAVLRECRHVPVLTEPFDQRR